MVRQTCQDRTMGAAPRRRMLPLRPAAAGLAAALSAALAIAGADHRGRFRHGRHSCRDDFVPAR